MAKISRQTIESIRDRLTLVDIASIYTQLKRVGSQYRGLSPFNDEKTPSFYIHPEKNVFKCYSSGYAGDLFRFVELKENLPFYEAVEWIANRFQLPIHYEDNAEQDQAYTLKKSLYAVHEAAAHYFHEQFLMQTAEGQSIRDYWEKERSFPLEWAKKLMIGYAPHQPYALAQYLNDKQFPIETLKQSGLFYTKSTTDRFQNLKSRFLGRLMIPIRDIQGRIIAFTGRVTPLSLKDDPTFDAKYVNSPETPLFNKSQVVFGLDYARQKIQPSDKKGFMLVEGQLDVIRCWQMGLHTAIAPQGTGITEQQLNLIKRYHSVVHFVMDGDAAGQRAAIRVLPMAIQAGIIPYFITLLPKEDPDSLLSAQGADALNHLYEKSQTDLHFILQHLAPNGRASSPYEKEAALQQIFTIYSKSNSPLILEEALKSAGEVLGVSERVIASQFLKNNKPLSQHTKIVKKDPSLTQNVDVLLIAACSRPEVMQTLAEALQPEWVDGVSLSGILLKRFLAAAKEGLWQGDVCLPEFFENGAERDYFYEIKSREPLVDNDMHKAAQEAFQHLRQVYFLKQKERLTNLIANTHPDDNKALTFLQNERIKIRNLLKERPKLHFS